MKNFFLLFMLFLLGSVAETHAQNFAWAKQLSGNGPTLIYAVKADAAGNSYVAGGFFGTVDFDPSPTGTATLTTSSTVGTGFMAKYDPLGRYIWAKPLAGTVATDVSLITALALDANYVYVTGGFEGTIDFDPSAASAPLSTTGTVFMARYTTDGAYSWAKQLDGRGTGKGIAVDGLGNVYLMAGFGGVIDVDPIPGPSNVVSLSNVGSNDDDILVAKYTATGAYVWGRSVGSTGEDNPIGIGVDASGNCYVAGGLGGSASFNPPTNTTIITTSSFLAKYTTAGTLDWVNGLPREIKGIAVDAAGNSFLTGLFSGTVDVDPSASTTALTSAGDNDIFITKYGPTGNLLRAQQIGSSGEDLGAAIALDASGNTYLAGQFSNTVDFDPSVAGTANLSEASGQGFFIAKYNTAGNYVRARKTFLNSSLVSLATDGNQNAYLASGFAGTANVDPDASPANPGSSLTTVGFYDSFIAKFGECIGITGGPVASSVVQVGSTVTAQVSVSGAVSGYQWYQNGTALTGQTSATLSLTNVQLSQAGRYSVVVTGACGGLTSTAFALTVNSTPTLTGFAVVGSNTACFGSVLTFTATASVGSSYTLVGPYNTAITGTVGSTPFSQTLLASLAIPEQTLANQTITLTVGSSGSTISATRAITVYGLSQYELTANPPLPPTGLTIGSGQSVTLTAHRSETTFRWSNGVSGTTPVSLVAAPTSTTVYSVTGREGIRCPTVTEIPITVLNLPCGPVIHVTESGSGLQDGSSWGNSLPGRLLQVGIEWAAHCGAGQVWVAQGMYKPTSTTARDVSFRMRNNVAVYGGFLGLPAETSLNNRPPVNPVLGQISSSTLSGELGDPNSTTDNSYNLFVNSDSDNTPVLNGFVLTGANNDGSGFIGGAIENNESGIQITNCLFSDNTTSIRGGAIYNSTSASNNIPLITNCVFRNNRAREGGAIVHVSSAASVTAALRLNNCLFQNNVATEEGGAISTRGAVGTRAFIEVTNSPFIGNSAQTGGAIYGHSESSDSRVSMTLTNVLFQSNSATIGGAVVTSALFSGSTTAALTNCGFLNNTATDQGGGLANVAGQNGLITATLTNCSFQGNTATVGPAISSTNENRSSNLTLINSVLVNNGATPALFASNFSLVANYSLFEPSAPALPLFVSGPGNLTTSVSPFASTTSAELLACSPAINAGLNSATGLTGVTTDLAGNPRVFGGTVDMGAYEFQGASTLSVGITAMPSLTVTTGQTVTLTASGATSYSWSSGQSTSAISVTAGGTYSVTGTTGGCSGVSSVTVTANAPICYSVVYVTQNGAGLQNGSSWANAYPGTMLQTAINTAASCGGGQVLVARGLYKPTSTTDRTASFSILSGVTVRGGYAADGTPGTRTAFPSSSTLTGVLTGGNRSYHVVQFNEVSVGTTLDGFVITGGNADGSSFPDNLGGGILSLLENAASSPTLSNLVITQNRASENGGGIFASGEFHSLTATNTLIQSNTAISNGGGGEFNRGSSHLSSLSLIANTAEFGGGITMGNSHTLTGANVLFQGNTATGTGFGGGLYVFNGIANLNSVTFTANSSKKGGGIYITEASSSLTIKNSLLQSNSASVGGGLSAFRGGNSTLNSLSVIANSASNDGGGVYVVESHTLTATNSLFQNNTATATGGGIWIGQARSLLVNSLWQGNVAAVSGGAASVEGVNGSLTLVNATLYNNTAPAGTVLVTSFNGQARLINAVGWGNGTPANTFTGGSIQASYSLFETGTTSFTDGGNNRTATVSPFASTTSVELSPCSPAVNAGDPATTSATVGNTDLAGNARFRNNRIDMGAYESAGTTLAISASTATPVVCQGTRIEFTGSGGGTYSWSGPQSLTRSGSNFTLFNVQPNQSGAYTLVVTDVNGCTASTTVSVTVNPLPATPTIARSVVGDVCGGSSVTLSVAPAPNVTYVWQRGMVASETRIFTPFGSGTAITATQGGIYRVIATSTQTSCSVAASTDLFLGDYRYVGSIDASDPTQLNRFDRDGDPSTCAIPKAFSFDSDGNIRYDAYTLVNPRSVPVCAVIGTRQPQSCDYQIQSAAYLGNFDPTSVSVNYAGDGGATWDEPGFYEITIPANGTAIVVVHGSSPSATCSSYTLVVDIPREAPTLTISPNLTAVCPGTSLTFAASVANTYTWNTGHTTQNVSTTPTATTAYAVTLGYGNGGCSATPTAVSVSVGQVSPTLVARTATGALSNTLTCTQLSLTLTATSVAGGPGTSYSFSGPGILSQNPTAGTAVVNVAGEYSVTVTTGAGCSGVVSTTISSNTTAPTVSLAASNSLNCSLTSTTLTATASGFGSLTYTFMGGTLAGTPSSNSTVVVTTGGSYSVLVTAANGCTALQSTSVASSTALPTASLATSGSINCTQTSVTLTASGGTSYTFAGPGLVSQNASAGTAVVSAGGTYTVTVANASGCTSSTTATVMSNTTAPTVSISATSGTLTCAVTSITLTATSSGTGLRWSNAATTTSITVNSAGTYSVTTTAANGCSAVSNTVVIGSNTAAPTGANLTASNSGTITCSVQTLTLTASATGTSLSYVFAGPSGTLSGSGNTRPVSALGLYSVTITGANGCTTSASTAVFSNTVAPSVGLVASGTITCSVPAVTLTASPTGSGLTYAFTGSGLVSTMGNSATVNVGGTYSVTVLNPTNGCFSSTTVSVSSDLGGAPAAPTLSASSSVVCAGSNVRVVATVGGSSPMMWYRNGQPTGQTSTTLSLGGVQATQAGSYVLVVSGACSVTSQPFNLTVNSLPTVTLSFPIGTTVVGPGTGVGTITLPDPLPSGFDLSFGVFGGVRYERVMIIDRINGFEIRQVDSSTGRFAITRPGPFTITATDSNGCRQTVQGVITNLPANR